MADSDCSDDDWATSYYDNDLYEPGEKQATKLTEDIMAAQNRFGESFVKQTLIDVDCTQVDLHITKLDYGTAGGIADIDPPYVVRLHINPVTYGEEDEDMSIKSIHRAEQDFTFTKSREIAGIIESFKTTFIQENSSPDAPKSSEEQEEVPTADYGQIGQLLMYLQRCIPKLGMCHKYNCVMSAFSRLPCKGGCEVNTEELKFMTAVATAACKSARRKDIFQPFPVIFDQTDHCYTEIERTLMMLNSGTEISDPQITCLRSWIETYTSRIKKLPRSQQLRFLGTNNQYIIQESPEKIAAFEAAKAIHGSKFAFHGSMLENWWSIINNGLKVMSHTEHELHGSLLGKGIYFSPRLGFATRYSPPVVTDTPSEDTPLSARNRTAETLHSPYKALLRSRCHAICEVINDPKHIRKRNKGKGDETWRVNKAEYVCLRIFFSHETMERNIYCINSQNSGFVADIKDVLNMYS